MRKVLVPLVLSILLGASCVTHYEEGMGYLREQGFTDIRTRGMEMRLFFDQVGETIWVKRAIKDGREWDGWVDLTMDERGQLAWVSSLFPRN